MKSFWKKNRDSGKMSKKPPLVKPLGITMGCPAGVGPEIIIKAFSDKPEMLNSPRFVVLGDINILEKAARAVKVAIRLQEWTPGKPLSSGGVNVHPLTELSLEDVPWGGPTPLTGAASYRYVTEGIRLCMGGELSGLVTAPISKYGLKLADIPYPGHTEILADMTDSRDYAMMLAGDRLRVVLVTIHCPLREVPSIIDTEKILQKIFITKLSLQRDLGIEKPRIAVAGLNPHAGESGLFGHEEEQIIAPAVESARSNGIEVSGPYPPDTVFYYAARGRFDAVVCQYHDQGLIPFKLLHFRDGVNLTLGLPIVRTSVDHGTAYDIAGTGEADPSSLAAAVDLAEGIVINRVHNAVPPGD
jgi:4-hydroxythreonine-4-phosphate dehydrogenase